MYKVFFNEKSITITVSTNITLNKTNHFFVDSYSAQDIKKWFHKFTQNEVLDVFLIHSKPEHFLKLFQTVFTSIFAAGGVVLRQNEVLFIFRNRKWDLPKGKIDKGETNVDAAIREVEEECGITNLEIIKQLPSTFHIYQSSYKKTFGQWVFKETFWFEMKYVGKDSGEPQLDEGITKVKWFEINNLDEVLANTFKNLIQIILLYRT